jgi:hypothetical protein
MDSADLTIWVSANHFDNADRDGPAWRDESDAALWHLKVGPRPPWWQYQYVHLLRSLSASPISPRSGDTR